jgi:hypothetical protein
MPQLRQQYIFPLIFSHHSSSMSISMSSNISATVDAAFLIEGNILVIEGKPIMATSMEDDASLSAANLALTSFLIGRVLLV